MLDEYYINNIGSDKRHLSDVPAIWILPVLKTDDASENDVIVKTDISRKRYLNLHIISVQTSFAFEGTNHRYLIEVDCSLDSCGTNSLVTFIQANFNLFQRTPGNTGGSEKRKLPNNKLLLVRNSNGLLFRSPVPWY